MEVWQWKGEGLKQGHVWLAAGHGMLTTRACEPPDCFLAACLPGSVVYACVVPVWHLKRE